jgi:hypothetical protein
MRQQFLVLISLTLKKVSARILLVPPRTFFVFKSTLGMKENITKWKLQLLTFWLTYFAQCHLLLENHAFLCLNGRLFVHGAATFKRLQVVPYLQKKQQDIANKCLISEPKIHLRKLSLLLYARVAITMFVFFVSSAKSLKF